MFVSSNRWDVMGATAFGFGAVWINRSGMPEEYAQLPPLQVLPNLHDLPALL
jgi:2-haloacid dehalogenase